MRDHQQRHVDDRNRIGGTELSWHHIKASLNGVEVVDDDVRCPREIECDNEKPEERAYPCGEKRRNGQHSSGEVTVGGKRCEAGGHIRAHDARKDENEPKESEAV